MKFLMEARSIILLKIGSDEIQSRFTVRVCKRQCLTPRNQKSEHIISWSIWFVVFKSIKWKRRDQINEKTVYSSTILEGDILTIFIVHLEGLRSHRILFSLLLYLKTRNLTKLIMKGGLVNFLAFKMAFDKH